MDNTCHDLLLEWKYLEGNYIEPNSRSWIWLFGSDQGSYWTNKIVMGAFSKIKSCLLFLQSLLNEIKVRIKFKPFPFTSLLQVRSDFFQISDLFTLVFGVPKCLNQTIKMFQLCLFSDESKPAYPPKEPDSFRLTFFRAAVSINQALSQMKYLL